MSNHYKRRFAKIVEAINSDAMKEYAQLNHLNSFTRKRKMPLEDIILCTLSKKGLTTIMEIHKYFTQKGATSEKITGEAKRQGYKYSIRVNENIAIGLFKEELIKILIEQHDKEREEQLIQLQDAIERYVVPVRKLKSQERKHNLYNKYKNNQKSSF